MLIITSLLAIALAAPPQPSCVAATQTGTFRFTAVDPSIRGASSMQVGMIVLENINGCLEATVLTDAGAPSVIDGLRFDGDSISGMIHTNAGQAKVSLRLDSTGVAGSIVNGRHVWTVNGTRTSDVSRVSASSSRPGSPDLPRSQR